jgi:hypothetical protein
MALYVCRPPCPVALADGTGVNGKHKINTLYALGGSAVRKADRFQPNVSTELLPH